MNSGMSAYGPKRTWASALHMSASLIGRFGSSAFRLSTITVSVSLAGSCFSSESAPGPFHHGIRERGGPIFRSALPSIGGRSKQTYDLTSSIVPRGTSFHRAVELEFLLFNGVWLSCRHGFFPAPAERGAVDPDTVHDYGQPTRQRHDCFLHAAASGDLHRPNLEPGPFH